MSEREIVCADLNAAIDDLRRDGFRLDLIYPADEPQSAVLSNGARSVRLTTHAGGGQLPSELPPLRPEFVLSRAGEAAAVEGRAGMLYRDLIPGRLGGRYIASLIRIPHGGPVSDWVHFHHIALQALYVASGWVRVVYQDQGVPFVLEPGDLVLQPPGIRHQVLESSDGLEVIEIAAPALHATFADHDMQLPTAELDPLRNFSGQHFLRHVASETSWIPRGGWEAQETALADATGGLMEARTLRPNGASALAVPTHDGELQFGYVLDGSATLRFGDEFALSDGDAFVIPPGRSWTVEHPSADFRLLQVSTATL